MNRTRLSSIILAVLIVALAVSVAPAEVIDKQAIVTGVNKPGDGGFDALTVANGDQIVYTKYEPTTDDYDVRIAKGMTYNMFMLTQTDNNNAQAFIVWSPDDPMWQDKLSKTNTVVRGIGVPGPNTLKRGDSVQISVQPAEGGGTDVTIDAWRGREAVATFSFVVK